jgi:hypothetical protein
MTNFFSGTQVKTFFIDRNKKSHSMVSVGGSEKSDEVPEHRSSELRLHKSRK